MFSAFLQYLWKSKSIYRIHSPFVYHFATQILPNRSTQVGREIEKLRKRIQKSSQKIEFEDFGAGANKTKGISTRPISEIAKKSARRRKQGELLFRICQYYQPQRCLEFGTNLGISALYQLAGLGEAQFLSMEGSPALSKLAQNHIQNFGFQAQIFTGEFSDLLKSKINLAEYQPDYVFLDGNHQYQPTVDYVKQLLPIMPAGSILIMDDINWSKEMRKAWLEIIEMEEVTVSLDLFYMGICFIKRNQEKEQFQIFWSGVI